ncbi:hypothetical protein SAMN04488120_102228 [Fontimonas thermophila]|uniref:Peptidase propeptide and YPEB domain-containing protein n=1 Tax=Fontimonas thermophila TaxID=1076937 RepID=A0A1I2HUZ2_9GAMM|nr:hypothetical protein [Fontimonas thermophila]SFF33223.1 hypothetical protein SAMN04488120_102228 [Fontimonas thermophila]
MRRLLLILCLIAAAPLAFARGKVDRDRPPERIPEPELVAPGLVPPRDGRQALPMMQPAMTPAEAARQVQRQHGGRILAVQPDGLGYRVKVLKDGEVRIYSVTP